MGASEKEPGKDQDSNEDILFYDYRFTFHDGSKKELRLSIAFDTLSYIPQRSLVPDSWTALEFNQCTICPLEPKKNPHCPIALSIKDIVADFDDRISYEEAEIRVITKERYYYENTTLQRGLSSILGILMVTSGCPVMDKLRPMVRFHLPFPTILETTFRTTGTYLLGQFFMKKRGQEADFTFQGLSEIYHRVTQVNKAMAERIRKLSQKDASVNALILLDLFAMDVPLSIEDQIEDLEPFFHTYFEGPALKDSKDEQSR
jgi:hypothetical protein